MFSASRRRFPPERVEVEGLPISSVLTLDHDALLQVL